MKVNLYWLLAFVSLFLTVHIVEAAMNKTVFSDAPTREYVFVENNNNDNFFVTPTGALDPRMTGSNRWTGLKYNGSGTIYQQSLGYIDNGYNTLLLSNRLFDMWLENAPTSHLITGLRCINWYKGCDMATSLILPEATDAAGFYGVSVPSGGAKWMHGMMSDQFYHYLNNASVGSNFTMTINTCTTAESYSAHFGQRCRNMASGNWYVRKVSYTKGAHLKFENTNGITEVFINSDGVPTLGEGNSSCYPLVIGKISGLACKMLTYSLRDNGMSNSTIKVFPSINKPALESVINAEDMQFSLDSNTWKTVSKTSHYFTFNELKGKRSVYIFLSQNFFKQMVKLGISDSNTNDLFNFRMHNALAPESGWYEFSTSSQLIIKPRDFSVSIISKDYVQNPSRTGKIGSNSPSLDFDYIVTTNGKTSADEVLISVTGPTQKIYGRSWCIFKSLDSLTQVPFPASLTYKTRNGVNKTHDVGCDGLWRDMTDAFWLTTPWFSSNGAMGLMNKSNVRFSIPMNDERSLYTLNHSAWFGDVSASGEIRIKATWRNVN